MLKKQEFNTTPVFDKNRVKRVIFREINVYGLMVLQLMFFFSK